MDRKKILMIDDEEELCSLVKKGLESVGDYEVHTALNGKDGIHLAEKTRPDLILLDLMMPGMDGFQVLDKLKKDRRTMSIPVAVLSVRDDDAAKLKSLELYDELYITKPIGIIELKAKIEEIFKRRKGLS
jgi:DNA-binding response OmpR family regulator